MDEYYIMSGECVFNIQKLQELSDILLNISKRLYEAENYIVNAGQVIDDLSNTEYKKVQTDLENLVLFCRKLSGVTLDISSELEIISENTARQLEKAKDNMKNIKIV